MPKELIYQDSKDRRIEWDTVAMCFNVDGVEVSPDMLIQLVNSDGSHALQFKREGDQCTVNAFKLEVRQTVTPTLLPDGQ